MVICVIFLFAAAIIWLAPKPKHAAAPGTGGHSRADRGSDLSETYHGLQHLIRMTV